MTPIPVDTLYTIVVILNKFENNYFSSDNSKTAEDDGEIAAQSQYDSVTHTDIEL